MEKDKIVLIISEDRDGTTNEVVEWLKKYKIPAFRINSSDKVIVRIINVKEKIFSIIINEIELYSSNIEFLWYRKGMLSFVDKDFSSTVSLNGISEFINLESLKLNNYLFEVLREKMIIGDFKKSFVNKLENIVIAKMVGFEVPETIITSEKCHVNKLSRNFNIVSKPIGECLPIKDNNNYYQLYTVDVCHNDFIDNVFFPTLLQQKIEKWIELRVFVVKDLFFSMAIFSQNSKQTSTDYRDYDKELMNRMVPFEIPSDIKNKIVLFMKKTDLDTGSFDFIVDTKGVYYFLEINPVGNIEMVSKYCNYYIEKAIAQIIRLKYEK